MGIAGALLAAFHMPVYGQAGAPLINEFVINHTGSDVNEFIEVFGVPNTEYSAFTILEIEGDDGGALGVVDGVFPVGTTNAGGVWTTGLLNSVVENGTVTLLLVKNFTGSAGLDLDTNDDGFLDPAPPWTRLVDAIAVTDGGNGDFAYSHAVLTPGFDGHPTTPGGASRFPNGIDTDTADDWLRNDFEGDGLPAFPDAPPAPSGEAVNTPEALNRPGFTFPPPPAPRGLIINEIDADTPGSDTREFVELYDGGSGHTPLDDLVLVLFNGSNDLSYRAFDLDGFTTNADGFFVMGGSAVFPPPDLILPNSTLQNGPDAVALFAGDTDDFPNRTPITTQFLVDAVVYDTDDPIDPVLLTLLNTGQPQVNENGRGNKESVSIQRLPNGAGGARNTTTYTPFPPTPGSINGGADLSLRQRIAATTREGPTRTIRFAILLSNDGPAHATGIAVTVHLPAGLTFAQASATQGLYNPGTNVWTVGDLVNGDAATLHLSVTTGASDASITLAEVIAVDQPDPDSTPGDGQGDDAAATAFDRPRPTLDRLQADLRLTLSVAPTTARVGETATFTLIVTNDGPSATAGVEVTARLPDELAHVLDTGAGRYDAEDRLWRVGHLGKDASKTLAVSATVTRSGSLLLTAEITRNNLPDPDSYFGNGNPDEDDWAEATIQAQAAAGKAPDAALTASTLPEIVTLGPNYPNPFNPSTEISFALPETAHVTLILYDLLGRTVATLADGPVAAGRHTVRWQASSYPSGLYLARLRVNDETLGHYMTLMR